MEARRGLETFISEIHVLYFRGIIMKQMEVLQRTLCAKKHKMRIDTISASKIIPCTYLILWIEALEYLGNEHIRII